MLFQTLKMDKYYCCLRKYETRIYDIYDQVEAKVYI